jgi:hypothetical protein
MLHQRLYREGFSKAQEGAERYGSRHGWAAPMAVGLVPPVMRREFILKDLRIFFRDTTQWSQLILLACWWWSTSSTSGRSRSSPASRCRSSWSRSSSFLNQGLAGFVLAAIAARFIFPSPSRWRAARCGCSVPRRSTCAPCCGASTGRDVPAAGAGADLTVITNVMLQGHAVHDGGERGHDRAPHLAVGGPRTGASARSTRSSRPRTQRRSRPSFGGLVFMMLTTQLAAGLRRRAVPVCGCDRRFAPDGASPG